MKKDYKYYHYGNQTKMTCFLILCFSIFINANASVVINNDALNNKNTTQVQEIIIGVVTDANGQPLPGASIIEKGTKNGTQTDFDGKFSIQTFGENAVLVISFIGFTKKEVPVTKQTTNLTISLEEDTAQLDEVVVIGYGSARKGDLTGAVASISAREIEDLPDPNLLNQIQGRVAGLTITNSNFTPGDSPSILIRGKNSITAGNEPLIILDGIPYSGSISTINPNDIETFNVLKDASSTAIYGSRGSNGVIIITTKAGKTGRPKVTYNASVGFNSIIQKLDLLNAEQYVAFRDFNGTLQPSEQANLASGNITDWQDLVTRTAIQQEHSLGVSGGTEDFSYYLGLGNLDQEGIVLGQEFRRTSFRFNGTYTITDWLKIGTTNQITEEDFGDQGDVNLRNTIRISPLGTPFNSDGSQTFYPITEDEFFANPLDPLLTQDTRVRRQFVNNAFVEIKAPFVEGLSYKLNYGRSELRDDRDRFEPTTSEAGANIGGGRARRRNRNIINSTTENILNYDRQFGDHHLGLTALYSFQRITLEESNMEGRGFVNDQLGVNGIGSGEIVTVSTPYERETLISQMGRLNYDYKGKYYLTATVRRDGSSNFGDNNKFGVFPSVALGWTITKEDFAQDIDWLNFLKLRVSYGENGNQDISPYSDLTQISNRYLDAYDNNRELFLNYLSNNEQATGFAPAVLGNPELAWEATKTFNFGLDYSLLDGKVSGNIEYYSSTSDGLLLNRQLNATQGFSSILQNIGEVENKGLEINVNVKPIQTENFNWDIGFNFFTNKNKIVKLADEFTDDIANGWFIGEDIDSNFNFVGDGVLGTQAEIDASATPDAALGDRAFKDIDNNGFIDDKDRAIQGSRTPDFTLGINNNLAYKNVTLSFLIYTVQGVTEANGVLDPRSYLNDRANYANLDYWSPDNTDATSPRPDFEARNSEYFQDKSFIRLKNITLGYKFNQDLIDKIGLSGLNLYVTGNNLWTQTDWSGFDPESTGTSRTAANGDANPSFKTVVFGLNLSF
ncbi:TonB-dependent receptor [Flavivirga amylovorans]|uniref:TonB-dependent receptor n=1 Tax=Flavivirga amylovorans TaxID=870486 RepID=A0ABT8WZI6_9FLAO|nr:TonB-dependent receptor [Flavivirga amylovorans]MDO5987088.1 TonB-dependent receptor [Flavivirga amylovorans]